MRTRPSDNIINVNQRNQKVYKRIPPDPNHLLLLIQRCHRDHLMAWAEKASQDMKVWKAPCMGYVKINSDAVVRESFVAIACICHDFRGETSCGLARRFCSESHL